MMHARKKKNKNTGYKTKTVLTLLFLILAAAAVVRIGLGVHGEVWWDSGVYIGMGKWFWSGGAAGLNEHIRPPILPLVIGALWKAGLDPLLFGRILMILAAAGLGMLTFVLARRWTSDLAALFAATLVAFSPTVLSLSGQLYTEIPAIALGLLGILLAMRDHMFLSGLVLGAAFLTKFPAGLFLLAGITVALVSYQHKKKTPVQHHAHLLPLLGGFALPVLAYFISNLVLYGSALGPLIDARAIVRAGLGCTVLRPEPWWFYFKHLVTGEGPWHLLALAGAALLWKQMPRQQQKRKRSFVLPLIIGLAAPLLYFILLPCREPRFAILFLPFVAMLTGEGMSRLLSIPFPREKKGKPPFKCKPLVVMTLIIIAGFNIGLTISTLRAQEPVIPQQAEAFFTSLSTLPDGELWTSNPVHAVYTDRSVHKIYYPVFDAQLADTFTTYVKAHKESIAGIALDNCGGGVICPPGDSDCGTAFDQMLDTINAQFTKTVFVEHGRCWYAIWAP